MLENQLKSLGLTSHEANIYSVLSSNSPASATFIAKKCGLSRSSVYTSLNSLIGKGLVGTSYKNEIKQFVVEDIDALHQMVKNEESILEKKKSTLADISLSIKALQRSAINIPEVIVFEGQAGLKKIYTSMLRQALMDETMMIVRDEFVWQENWQFVFKNDWHDKVKRLRQEKNIKTKLLVNNSALEKTKSTYYKSRKALNYKYLLGRDKVNNFAMYIVGDTVSILSTENNNPVGIKIVNKHLADNYKTLFNGLWNSSTN
ncbi:MAG: helix-turn-helix domain-containing protein [Candidatus Paceibacterota bacterium]|jgi:sugar-specific transcriptional regulator TrmB